MATLDELTEEQEALMDVVAEEYIRELTTPAEPDPAVIKRWLDVVYSLYDKKCPTRIEVAASPEAALKLATELTGAPQTSMDWCGAGDGGWVSFYDYFARIGVLTPKEAADLLALKAFGRVAWDTVLLDECAIVIRRPVLLKVDDAGSLHAADGPCIEWADGEKEFAWHGTWVPECIIMGAKTHTRDEYLAITNTEHRRAIGEIAGWQWVCDLLGASEVDRWKDETTGLSYVLMATADGQKMLKKQSPRLKSRKQPSYVEPVHEDCKTARGARKWQATTLTPQQCDKDPVLSYGVEA